MVDYLIIGSGLSGLSLALKLAPQGRVLILTKSRVQDTNTAMAQGGVAAVMAPEDSFENHSQDTLVAGAGLCKQNIVDNFVSQAPARMLELLRWGVPFDLQDTAGNKLDLGREGGHSARRILHVADHTGQEIHRVLLARVLESPSIQVRENQFVIDLITTYRNNPEDLGPNRCLGAHIWNADAERVETVAARHTVLATGGAGRIYRYSSNWSGATGDGVAMAYRAGARVTNLEFMQFHPTCLYHPEVRNFLITEALRGEGCHLLDQSGRRFMDSIHPLGSLAPRDIVARGIDHEMKRTGSPCVHLDTTVHDRDFYLRKFPVIYQKCAELGMHMETQAIPVVPAAHYLCGGVLTDAAGQTDVQDLYVIGESACTGLHGANRLASNSLLECLGMAHNLSELLTGSEIRPAVALRPWINTDTATEDEMAVIHHMWDEIRMLMWNYVGIVRTDRRLRRARNRLKTLLSEIREYYWSVRPHPAILELRNLALTAALTVESALQRKESRGIHFNLDWPGLAPEAQDSILSPGRFSDTDF